MPRETGDSDPESFTDGVYFDLQAPQHEERFFEFEVSTGENGHRYVDMVQHDTGTTVRTWWDEEWDDYVETARFVRVADRAVERPVDYLILFIESHLSDKYEAQNAPHTTDKLVALTYAYEHTSLEAHE